MLLTKSPVRFAAAALTIARAQLPQYRTKYSRHDFEWPQLVTCLLVGQFLRLDYRGTEQMLVEHEPLRRTLELRRVPDHTVLCRAMGNISPLAIEKLLDETVTRLVRLRRRQTPSPKT